MSHQTFLLFDANCFDSFMTMYLIWDLQHVQIPTYTQLFNSILWSRKQNISTFGWIATQFGADIPGPLGMNLNNFGNPLTFHVASPAGQDVLLSNFLLHEKVSESTKHDTQNV